MALATPRKDYRYILELNGADAFLIQEITPPEVELTEVMHAGPGNTPNAKTPGKMTVGDLVVKKLKPANRADTWCWDLMASAASELIPDLVQTGFLKELGPNMVATLQSYFLGDCWVKKITHSGFKGEGSENIIEEVTFAVRYYFPTDSVAFQALLGGGGAAAAGQAFAAGIS